MKMCNLCHLMNKISGNMPGEVIITKDIHLSDEDREYESEFHH